MYDTHFYVRGSIPTEMYLGSTTQPLKRVHAEYQPPYSHAWFCPDCGEVWARAAVVSGSYQSKFTIEGGQCDRHPSPSPYHVPGTMLLVWDDDFNSLLLSCPDAVKREFELHLQYAERNLV